MTPAMKHAREGRRMLWSTDPKTPTLRLVLETDDIIEVREESATAVKATRSESEVHERLVMTRAQAEWLCRELAAALGMRVVGSVK